MCTFPPSELSVDLSCTFRLRNAKQFCDFPTGRGLANCSAAEARAASAQIALELGGQRVAVDLAERLAHVHVGVAALFEGGHVLGDLVVLGGHLADRLLPL